MMGPDLRLAARRGYVLLPTPGLRAVEAHEGVLRYDPTIRRDVRAQLVLAAMRRDTRKKRIPKTA